MVPLVLEDLELMSERDTGRTQDAEAASDELQREKKLLRNE